MTARHFTELSSESHMRRCWPSLLALLVASSFATAQHAEPATAAMSPRPFAGFVQNQGQWATAAEYVADFDGLLVRAEPGAIVLQKDVANCEGVRRGVVRMAFEGSQEPSPRAGQQSGAVSHFLVWNDPDRWQRSVPSFTNVVYESVAPGVDVDLLRRDGGFAYDVHVDPAVEVESFVVPVSYTH